VGEPLHPGEVPIDDALARAVVASRFPAFADLPLRRNGTQGTMSVIHRLGDHLGLRLPRTAAGAGHLAREEAITPHLEALVGVGRPTPIAVVDAAGQADDFPFPAAVFRWVPGQPLDQILDAGDQDPVALAAAVGTAVRRVHDLALPDALPTGGRRTRCFTAAATDAHAAIDALAGNDLDVAQVDRAHHIVDDAAAATERLAGHTRQVLVHGDVLAPNVVVDHGLRIGLVDWGSTGLGDPAADAMVAWSFDAPARSAFRAAIGFDEATWVRSRGWALEQAATFVPYYRRTMPTAAVDALVRVHRILGP
jgi:aminoglycoside phosphotransferase (APT) family kinase protein